MSLASCGVRAADHLGVLGQLRYGRDGEVELAEHLLGQRANRLGGQLVGPEGAREVRVHLRGGGAEPARLAGEVAAGARRAHGLGRPGAVKPSAWRSPMSASAYRSRTLVAASVQPSVASRRYRDKIARIVGTPSSRSSAQPSGSAMCDEPSWASAAVTSRSGLGRARAAGIP